MDFVGLSKTYSCPEEKYLIYDMKIFKFFLTIYCSTFFTAFYNRGVAWSSGQRRSLSLQGSRDWIPVFPFLFISETPWTCQPPGKGIGQGKRNKARPANRGRKTGRRFRNGYEKGEGSGSGSNLLVRSRHPAAHACTWGNREWEGVCGGVFKVHSAGHPLKRGGT